MEIRYHFRRGDFLLDVDSQIADTGVTGIFGASGSGKTTLLRCIAGLEAKTGGPPVHERRIGYVFQQPQLFELLDVRGNIDYGRRRGGDTNADIASTVDLLGVRELLDRPVATLSGGEAQRVAIARALAMSPRLILMDEPLASLDEARKDEVLPFLDELCRETRTPIVYVSHDIAEITRLCDRLLVLDDGRVVADGDLQELLTRGDVQGLDGRQAAAMLHAQRVDDVPVDGLYRYRFSGGELWSPVGHQHRQARLRILADDVSLARVAPQQSTILNSVEVQVVAIVDDGPATHLLRLACGEDLLLARVTRRSVKRLSIGIGDRLYAQVKSVTIRR